MIKNEYILKVDLKKKHTAVTPTFVQYDEAVLRFLISDNGKPFFFSGQTSIKTYHRRKDGVVVEGEARVEVVKGIQQIVYEYSGNEMYQLGYVEASLVIYSGDKKVSIQPFKVLIVDSIYDDVATPANPEYGALQHLIASVEDLVKKVNVKITEANAAIDNANNAAENVQTTISEWKYADTYSHTTNYKKNNVVSYNGSTFIAIRDTKGNYPIGNLSDDNWRIMALKGQDGVVVLNKEDFVATLNQTDFTLPLEYDQHQGRVRVIVDGVEQFTPDNFVELSSTKIRMNSGLRKDADVKVIYFGNAPALKNDIQLQIDNINDLLEFFNLAEANAAITHATTQGDYAKVQGDYAKLKGDATIAAVTQANTARDSANSAATSANTAATNANTAKDATVLATTKANTATALVESATSNANTATTNAITAANDANTAKNNANQAAVNANDAVANMSPKGAYSSTTNYLPRNIVSYLGSSYMNIVASRGILPTVTANWQPVASKGDKGDTGFGFTWRKEYNPATAYIKDDVVYYNGSSYIALKSVTGITPSNDNVNWNIITQRGLDGAGSVSSVNGVSPDLDGNVAVPVVTSVNGQNGVITGLETVANSDNKLSTKVDKVTGKGLSTNDYTTTEKDKLANISPNANNYAHPDKHLPSIITQDENNRFVKDSQISDWDSKATTDEATPVTKGLMSSNDKTKLNEIESGAQVNTITSINGATGDITGLATDISVDNKIGVLQENVATNYSTRTELNNHTLKDEIHVTQIKKNEWDAKSNFSGKYNDLTEIPLEFSPTSHEHVINQVTGLQNALDSKTPLTSTGDLTALTTEDKTSLVNALNEVNAKPSGGSSEYVLINVDSTTQTYSALQNVAGYKKVRIIVKDIARQEGSASTGVITLSLMVGTIGSNGYAQQSIFGSATTDATRIILLNAPANGASIQKRINSIIDIDLESDIGYTDAISWAEGNWNQLTGIESGYLVEKFTRVIGHRTSAVTTPINSVQVLHPDLYRFRGTIEFWGIPR